jgi:hypothetical protein
VGLVAFSFAGGVVAHGFRSFRERRLQFRGQTQGC